ncbi:MAG: nucleotidyltransferase substrate binding protein, partial [Bacteroidetes bacterium]|nr:nucleotidyltransferase substrate binding protein [Bacteroidota bacterium]
KGTLLDAVNRAHQRGLIESIDKMREIRDLRNQIVHEYVKADLQNVFIDILEFTPLLISICNNIFEYCKKY